MPIPTPLTLLGAPGSPYTRKMIALLRYRRIPYRLIVGRHDGRRDLPQPKVSLLPTFYLPDANGVLEAVVDSTPLIRRFEAEFAERRVTPPDPVTAFIDYLLEDYADEWLTKAMFHYRWHYAADIERAGEILPRWTAVTAPEEQMQKSKRFIQQRQIERLYVVGSNDTTAPVIEASYRRFLAHFNARARTAAVRDGRPARRIDFGLYGQLTQLAHFDPTPMALTLASAARVRVGRHRRRPVRASKSTDGDWLPRDAIKRRLGDLLGEVGRVYAPFLLANAAALARGADEVRLTIDGKPWVQQPFPYQGRCLQWLRERLRGAVGRRSRGNGRDSQRHRM